MIDKLIEKIKNKENLTVAEAETIANEMFRLHKLDIAKWGKGNIPPEESGMQKLWHLMHNNVSNLCAVHKFVDTFLLSSIEDFMHNEQYGPIEDPGRVMRDNETVMSPAKIAKMYPAS